MAESKSKAQALYLCDGEAECCTKAGCYKNGGDCMLTTDINHAIENAPGEYPGQKE